MNIPFPFGIEPGCYATRRFQLNCASNRTLIGRPPAKYEVTNISLDDGLLYVNKLSEFEDANTKYLSVYYGGSVYFSQQLVYGLDKSDLSEEFAVWRWSATNLTCENAKSGSAYACRSTHSECLGVTNGKLYIGYRCKCSLGFEGNPYVQSGCIGTSSCSLVCSVLWYAAELWRFIIELPSKLICYTWNFMVCCLQILTTF
jgi:hypothetical protein